MKTRRAAIKEYLTAAARIANEIKKSCQRTWTHAHVSRPVKPRAKILSGSGSRKLPKLKLKIGLRSLLELSSAPSEEFVCCGLPSSFCSFSPLLFSANTTNLEGFLGIEFGVLRAKEEENGRKYEELEGFRVEIDGSRIWIEGWWRQVNPSMASSSKWGSNCYFPFNFFIENRTEEWKKG